MNPLAGRTVLITRSREQAEELGSLLAGLGARVLEAPVIGFAEPADWDPADRAFRRLDAYDQVILTSANAAERFCNRITRLGLTVSPRNHLIAIGPATARRMKTLGIDADAVATDSRAEGVSDLLLAGGSLAGQRILIPRAEVAREVLPERLREAGALVDVVTVYRTVPVPVPALVLEMIRLRQVDAIAFTSSSAVTNLLAESGGAAPLSGIVIAVIGPVTAQTARAAGLKVDVESPSPDMDGLAAAIAGYFEKRI